MVNVGVVLLIILTVILTIIIISALIYVGYKSSTTPTNGGITGGTRACSQTVNINSLIQIPDEGADCIQNGRTGRYYYIGNLGTGSYDYVVAPFGTQPLDVCVHFCTNGASGGICIGPNYNGKSAQTNFNNCMNQLSSTTCRPPLPIAAKGPTLYYAFSPTCNICDNCGDL